MSKVSVEIGASTKEFDAVVASLPAKMNSANQKMAQQAARSGSRMNGIGSASMQIQDIAVQLQMGTRMSTIIAQQGSQMLSAFGPQGMIVGGLVAVGGALVTFQATAQQAFRESQKSAESFIKSLHVAINLDSFDQLIDKTAQVREKMNEAMDSLIKRRDSAYSLAGAYFTQMLGGPSIAELDKRDSTQYEALEKAQLDVAKRLVELSQMEVKMIDLRSRGEAAAADEMERQLKIAREIHRIKASDIPFLQQQQLLADVPLRFPAKNGSGGGGGLFSSAMGGFANFSNANADSFKQQLLSSIGDQITKNRNATSALAQAAFSPLRGDADISTGRGSNFNSLTQGASKQIAEMTKQTNLLQKHADSLTTSNKHLASIDKIVAKLKTTPVYN